MPTPFAPHLNILPQAQRRIWQELSQIPAQFTLYGGTAIALHLGHRQSVDFDFFGSESFNPMLLRQSIPLLRESEVLQSAPDILTVRSDSGEPVQLSFFSPRLSPPLVAPDNNLKVASLLDLAGTKAAVVQSRAEAKDYVDLAALAGAGIDLPHALAAAQIVYGKGFNPQITLKALSYFDDGDLAALPQSTKRLLQEAARAVNLDSLPSITVGET